MVTEEVPEVVTEMKSEKQEEAAPVMTDHEIHHSDEEHTFDDLELPPVDYSGYTKHELVETMVLLVENRPPSEIRDDIDRLKILFYKKLKA